MPLSTLNYTIPWSPNYQLCHLLWLEEDKIHEQVFSSVQSLSRVQLFATPWIAAHQASLSITSSWSLLKLTLIKSVMPSSHIILCCPLLLLPPIPPSIRVFSNESALCIRWPKYWSFSFSISPPNERVLPLHKTIKLRDCTCSKSCPPFRKISCYLYDHHHADVTIIT